MRRETAGYVRAVLVAAATLWMLGAGQSGTVAAQVQTPNVSPDSATPMPTMGGVPQPDPADPYAARMNHARQVAIEDDRQKKMVADATKLLQLATDLKAEVDKQTRDETSVSAYKTADQIEKLAHDVKQRLKN